LFIANLSPEAIQLGKIIIELEYLYNIRLKYLADKRLLGLNVYENSADHAVPPLIILDFGVTAADDTAKSAKSSAYRTED